MWQKIQDHKKTFIRRGWRVGMSGLLTPAVERSCLHFMCFTFIYSFVSFILCSTSFSLFPSRRWLCAALESDRYTLKLLKHSYTINCCRIISNPCSYGISLPLNPEYESPHISNITVFDIMDMLSLCISDKHQTDKVHFEEN